MQTRHEPFPKSIFFLFDRLFKTVSDHVVIASPPIACVKIERCFHHKSLAVFFGYSVPKSARQRALSAEDWNNGEDKSGVIHTPIAHRNHHVSFPGENRF